MHHESCCYGSCSNNKAKEPNLTFIPFPKPCKSHFDQLAKDLCQEDNSLFERHRIEACRHCSKCLRWIQLCDFKGADGKPRTLRDINNHTYVCARHFANGTGPTTNNPDPLPSTESEPNTVKRKYSQIPEVKLLPKKQKLELGEDVVPSRQILRGLDLHCQPLLTFTREFVGAGWACEFDRNGSNFFTAPFSSSNANNRKVFRIQVSVSHSLECRVFVFGEEIPVSRIFGEQPSLELRELLDKLKTTNLCKGLTGFETSTSGKPHGGKICGQTGTVRSKSCKLLTEGDRCSECILHFETIRRKSNPAKDPLRQFTPEKRLKVTVEKDRVLKTRMRGLIYFGHKVCRRDNEDLLEILENGLQLEESSAHKIFVQAQIRTSRRNSVKGYRWAPEMIKWCLYSRQLSSEPNLTLPSGKTLFRYEKDFEKALGFPVSLPTVTAEILKALPDNQRYFALTLTEVRVTEGLTYKRQTGELVGYVNLDETFNTVSQLRQTPKTKGPTAANYKIQFTVSGLLSNIKFLYSIFPVGNRMVSEMYALVMNAVADLEQKFNVGILAVVYDSTADNRRLFHLASSNQPDDFRFSFRNYYAVDEDRSVFLVPDPSHVIRFVRNAFANSGSHLKNKQLWKNGQDILWEHVVQIYRSERCNLTDEHVNLKDFAKTDVKYALDVMSEDVAEALRQLYGDTCGETVNFIRVFQELFGVLSVRCLWEGSDKDVNLDPYMSAEDKRLRWLEEDFVKYMADWELDVTTREGPFTDSDRKKMLLSEPTKEALQILCASIPAIIRFLLEKGANFIPSTDTMSELSVDVIE